MRAGDAFALAQVSLLAGGLAIAALPALSRAKARQMGPRHPGLSPSRFDKNRHVRHEVRRERGRYQIALTFRDHVGQDWRWAWAYPRALTDAAIARFGVPESFFEPYVATAEVKRARVEQADRGLFRVEADGSGPDYPRMVDAYAPFLEPLVRLARRSGASRPRPQIQLLLKVLQDLPYAVPPATDGGRYLAGILPPPQAFIEGWGDCDTKAVALAAALRHVGRRAVLLHVPQHVLLGIEGIPRPYERFHTFQGRRFILAESAGPGRRPWGEPAEPYARYQRVEALFGPRPRPSPEIARAPVRASRAHNGSKVRLRDLQVAGGEARLSLDVDAGFQPVGFAAKAQAALPPNRAFMTAVGGRPELRLRPGAPGRFEAHVGAVPVKRPRAKWTPTLSRGFSVAEGAPDPGPFPWQSPAFVRAGVDLRAPWSARLPAGAPTTIDVSVPGARALVIRQNGQPDVRWPPGPDGRFTRDFTPVGAKVWLYAEWPDRPATEVLLYYGP